jgi:outer membrane protein assembly factor BamB
MAQDIMPALEPMFRPRRRRRFWFPLVVLGIALPLVITTVLLERAGIEVGVLLVLTPIVVIVALVALPVWFLFFSRFRRRTRLRVTGGVLLLLLLGAATVRKVEFTGSWKPLFIFRWQPKSDDLLAQHLSQPRPQVALPPIDLKIDPLHDFPRYRGANCDGVVYGIKLAADWKQHPPRLLWRHPCGGGYAGFAVAGNVVVTIEQRQDQEAVVCYDRATGQERWVYAYPSLFERSELMGGDGPRATPTIADGAVYALGANGHLACLDGATGHPRWTVNILEDNEARNAEWGMSGSPLIVNDLVVVNPGINPDHDVGCAVAAYDRRSGRRVWASGLRKAAYSSPQLATLAGKQQILVFDADGLIGLDPKTGAELWSYPWVTMMGMNITQPVVIGDDRVFISSERGNGCALLRIRRDGEKFSVEPVWKNTLFASKFCNPVAANGYIYGMSHGVLACLDQATGQRRWKDGRYGHGQVLLVDRLLLITSESGDVVLAAADPAEFRELALLPVFDAKTWNTPALAGRQLFVRNHAEMACFELAVE